MMQTKTERTYSCRGIAKHLNMYIQESDKLVILYESCVQTAVLNMMTAQFPETSVYAVSSTEHIKTFDMMETIVQFLSHKGYQKDCKLLIVGNRQFKELGGFIASSYHCRIDYLYLPASKKASKYDASNICGVDLNGIPNVLQSCYAPCMVFHDEDMFDLENK